MPDIKEDETETPEPPVDTTPAELFSWGISGQPITWALSTWTPVIATIRSANTGGADAATVQGVLDATFPDKGYQAADVMLAHPPVGDFSLGYRADEPGIRVALIGDDDLGLPPDNVTWDFGDGSDLVHDTPVATHAYGELGTYHVSLAVAVAGTIYGSADEANITTLAKGGDYDPGEHTVAEVKEYLAEHSDETDAVLAAEEAGKGRAGILDL